jgi:L-ascorbate metabolism protein UlaG (beta-lactamase superfamily)
MWMRRYGAIAVLAILALAVLGRPATAQCFVVAGGEARLIRASLPEEALARLTFLGHSSFLIETARGATAVTDYFSLRGPGGLPEIVTMNNAHSSHYTDFPDPAISHVLRGWSPEGGWAEHDVTVKDLRVRNVPTNVRDYAGGTRYHGNSIFVFEIEDLCIAHLGHLHHVLTPTHLTELGRIDVLLVPADGAYTMTHDVAADVIAAIGAPLVIPMHYFGGATLGRFLSRVSEGYEVVFADTSSVTLPVENDGRRRILVLPGF